MKDNGGRRRTGDRRCYSDSNFFPERRAIHRRTDMDRRDHLQESRPLEMERRQIHYHRVEEVA